MLTKIKKYAVNFLRRTASILESGPHWDISWPLIAMLWVLMLIAVATCGKLFL